MGVLVVRTVPSADHRPLFRLDYEANHGHPAEARVVAIYGRGLLVDYGQLDTDTEATTPAADAAVTTPGGDATPTPAGGDAPERSPSEATTVRSTSVDASAGGEPGSAEPRPAESDEDDADADSDDGALDVLAWRLEGDSEEPPALFQASEHVMVRIRGREGGRALMPRTAAGERARSSDLSL